ncbi:MAG: polysaccharide deacetylase family protein, partial [Candidatus Binatia bacterium]
MELALRVDVDTRVGLREGVPQLLDLFRRYSVQASFFITFGPDRSGWAVRRLIRPSFVAKMWRTNPFRLYGLRTILAGTILPSLPVGEGEPALLRDIVAEGHELGIHGYDHVRWQDQVEGMVGKEIEAELSKALDACERIVGFRPVSSAAPGWRCTPLSFAAQDRFGFLYASDVRGISAFLPSHNGQPFKTLQIPTTLPTLDELLGRQHGINDYLLSYLKDGLNVYTIHAEVEGCSYLPSFRELLEELIRRDVSIVRLRDVAERTLGEGSTELPVLSVVRQMVPGRSGWV